MLQRVVLALAVLVLTLVGALRLQAAPALAATCADHPNQASAQAAADTRDADGDGVYCESLPCPCSTGATPPPPESTPAPAHTPEPQPESRPEPTPQPRPEPAPQLRPEPAPSTSKPIPTPAACATPTGVQSISFSSTKYPRIHRHFLRALRQGWPRTLILNRQGADQRRNRLLQGFPTRAGYDRDEYPPAVGRGRGIGLTRGADPRGWRADVAYVPSSENRSHGSTLGLKLRRFCDGTRFRYVFY